MPLLFAVPQVENYAENLGEILRGDRIESSLYQLTMKHDEYCKVLCPPADYKQCAALPASLLQPQDRPAGCGCAALGCLRVWRLPGAL